MKRIHRPDQTTIYHCLSRTVHGQLWLDAHGKAVFCKIMHSMAEFCGIRVLTYCVMSNHFHLLLEVPPMAARDAISDAELVRRFRALYGEDGTRYEPISAARLEVILANGGAQARHWRKMLKERMHNLPLFMKLVKHRFTKWYNKTHKTYGTFWAERYSSLLVEADPDVLCKLACYIDLNPVRAGMVEDPALYAWSGYGAARMGNRAQHPHLGSILNDGCGQSDAFAAYERELYRRGSCSMGVKGKSGKIPMRIAAKYIGDAEPTKADALACVEIAGIIRKGLIYGSVAFIKAHAAWLQQMLGRKNGTHKMCSDAEPGGIPPS